MRGAFHIRTRLWAEPGIEREILLVRLEEAIGNINCFSDFKMVIFEIDDVGQHLFVLNFVEIMDYPCKLLDLLK
jgi:hypothetical protein